jgi:diguanylate cyclase (GGDEF)-like protein
VSPKSASSQTLRQLAPFAAVQLLAFASVSGEANVGWGEFWAALALTLLAVAAAVLPTIGAYAGAAQLRSALVLLLAAALLRHASGGASSGVSVLALLPVFWVALHGSRAHLIVVLAAVGAFFALPVVLLDPAAYPLVGLRSGFLYVAAGAIVGLTAQRLVAETRAQAHTAREREARMAALTADREQMLVRLRALAATDPLTGAGNRRAWDGWLAAALARADAHAARVAVAMLDLDHFKAYNDAFGHGRGDDLLVAAVREWQAVLRPTDKLARFGGEEFAVLLPECSLAEALAVIERLRAATPEGQTCSVCLAEYDGTQTADELVRCADTALYEAKLAGRDRSHVHFAPLAAG